MSERKKYTYACKVLPEEDRNIAHEHGFDPIEMHPAEIGEVRQLSVELSDEGFEAYQLASNLLEIEPEAEAEAQGFWDDGDGEVADADTGVAGVQIPANEDTEYAYSKWLRDGKQGEGIKVAVLDLDLGRVTANMLQSYTIAHKSWVGTNKDSRKHHGSHVACSALPENAKLIFGAVIGEDGTGSSADIIAGIHWAIDSGADVINLSLAGQGGGASYERAIKRARDRGILVFCAAGNNAQSGNPVLYPAACPSAISVAAFYRATDRKASFSTYNSAVDLAHSGVNVLSYGGDGRLRRMSGTSMASPNSTWVAAGLAAEHGVRGDELLKAMLSGARDTPSGSAIEGHGVAHAKNASARLEKSELSEPEKPATGKVVIFRGQGEHASYTIRTSSPMSYVESEWSSRQKNDLLSDGDRLASGTVSTGVDTVSFDGEIESIAVDGELTIEVRG